MKLKINICYFALFCSLLTGCFHKEKICNSKDIFLSGAVYQHEKDVILTTLRYMHIYSMLEKENIEAKKELDWFIDLMIMELESNQTNRIKLPHEIQSEIDSVKKDFSIERPEAVNPKSLCNRIAKFRKNNARIHNIPLSDEEKQLIESFINKKI
jgi:hypothetical protein